MSDHYKPIGGMFPGVRGSTKTGGTGESANKLVMLNGAGLLDDSMFSDSIKNAERLEGDLEDERRSRTYEDAKLLSYISNEASSRQNSDINLAGEISRVERDASTRMDSIEESIETLSSTVGDEESGLVKDVASLNTAMSETESEIGSIKANIGDDSSGIVKRIDDLESATSSVAFRVDSAERDIDQLEDDLSSASSSLTAVQNQLLTMSQLITNLGNDITTLIQRTNSLDSRVSRLERYIVDPSNY